MTSDKLLTFSTFYTSAGARMALKALLVASVAAACGTDDDDDDGASASSEDVEAYFDAFAETYCRGVAPCCEATGVSHDVATCRSLLTPFFFDLDGIKFDKKAAQQCLDELATTASSCPVGDEPAVCSRVLTGSVPPGGDCTYAFQCAPRPGKVDCSVTQGICREQVPAQHGQECSTESGPQWTSCYTDDDENFYCDLDTTICRPKSGVGEPCGKWTGSCPVETACSEDKLCLSRVPVGGDCSSARCVLEAYCDAANVCQPDRKPGEPCESGDECPGDNCDFDAGVCGTALNAFCFQ